VFRWFDLVFAGIIVNLSLPFLVVTSAITCVAVAVIALVPRHVARRGAGGLDFQREWSENQFRFKDSVRSYEDLIDAHTRRKH